MTKPTWSQMEQVLSKCERDREEFRKQRDTAIRLLREHAWQDGEVFRFLETVKHVDSPESIPFPDDEEKRGLTELNANLSQDYLEPEYPRELLVQEVTLLRRKGNLDDVLMKQRDRYKAERDFLRKLLESSLCGEKGCRKQAECFAVLNEGTHTELLVGCREHMPSIVRRASAFALLTSPRNIVEATTLPAMLATEPCQHRWTTTDGQHATMCADCGVEAGDLESETLGTPAPRRGGCGGRPGCAGCMDCR